MVVPDQVRTGGHGAVGAKAVGVPAAAGKKTLGVLGEMMFT